MTNAIDNTQNYLDVRDIIARVEYLRELRQPGPVDTGNPDDANRSQDDLFAELNTLESLLSELEGNGGDEECNGAWYPQSLIRDSYFTEAMQDLVSDIGDLPREVPAYLVIDWEATALNLQADYSSVDYEGVTYWYR